MEAVRLSAERGTRRAEDFRCTAPKLSELWERSEALKPHLMAFGKEREVGQSSTRATLHIPLLAELLDEHGMAGRAWRGQFIGGFPILRGLAEPRVYPADSGAATCI